MRCPICFEDIEPVCFSESGICRSCQRDMDEGQPEPWEGYDAYGEDDPQFLFLEEVKEEDEEMKPPEFQICSTCEHWAVDIDEDGHYTNLDEDILCRLHKKTTDCNYGCRDWVERGGGEPMIVKPEKKIAKAIWNDLMRRQEFFSPMAKIQDERREELLSDMEKIIRESYKKFSILR